MWRFLKKGLAEAKSKLSFRDFLLSPVRLARSRTPGFHPGNRGSNPLREAIFKTFGQKDSGGFLMPTQQQRDKNSELKKGVKRLEMG